MKDYGNTGMRPQLADVLTLQGAAEFNKQKEHKLKQINSGGKEDPNLLFVPGYLCDQPQFQNDAMLHHVNEMARQRGIAAPFPNVAAMKENNGEVFLSKYYEEQVTQNKKKLTQKGLCTCSFCIASPVEQLHSIVSKDVGPGIKSAMQNKEKVS